MGRPAGSPTTAQLGGARCRQCPPASGQPGAEGGPSDNGTEPNANVEEQRKTHDPTITHTTFHLNILYVTGRTFHLNILYVTGRIDLGSFVVISSSADRPPADAETLDDYAVNGSESL